MKSVFFELFLSFRDRKFSGSVAWSDKACTLHSCQMQLTTTQTLLTLFLTIISSYGFNLCRSRLKRYKRSFTIQTSKFSCKRTLCILSVRERQIKLYDEWPNKEYSLTDRTSAAAFKENSIFNELMINHKFGQDEVIILLKKLLGINASNNY